MLTSQMQHMLGTKINSIRGVPTSEKMNAIINTKNATFLICSPVSPELCCGSSFARGTLVTVTTGADVGGAIITFGEFLTSGNIAVLVG